MTQEQMVIDYMTEYGSITTLDAFKDLGINSDITVMANGIYIAIVTTIFGLAVAIILLPFYT